MKKYISVLLLSIAISLKVAAQSYPVFGPEIKVTVTGLTFDAMEPFISTDGNTLFFNSLNSGGNTNLYYAIRVDDSTFNYVGLVGGTFDPSPDHLDGVASMDTFNRFYWVSLRNFPNLHHGEYLAGNVINITRTYGDFNIFTPGWIIMDAAIHFNGDSLYYCNAYFGPTFTECPGIPCEARLGVAKKVNDSTFNKLSNTDTIFSNVNDTNYIVYAPQVTKDQLELYFTRILKNTFNSEICVSVRNSIAESFSPPMVIHSNAGLVPEAASPNTDKQIIYYHQKDSSGIFQIYLRYRVGSTATNEMNESKSPGLYPNPADHSLNVVLPDPRKLFSITVYDVYGISVLQTCTMSRLDISKFTKGIYFVSVTQNGRTTGARFVKE